MKAELFDCLGKFVRNVELPEGMELTECVTLDGDPYVFVEPGKYRCSSGNYTIATDPPPIEIKLAFPRPHTVTLASTRWLTGTVALARLTFKAKVETPVFDAAWLTTECDRAIRLSGMYCPQSSAPARAAANAFFNTKQVGVKMTAHVLAVDIEGRLVCEVSRHFRGNITSARTTLLATNLFQPCAWLVT